MHPGYDIIISDTSCLILLSKIDEIDLLKKCANSVFITPLIEKEFGKPLPAWLVIKEPKNNQYQKILEMEIDPGEASAIVLSVETDNAVLIIDDLKGKVRKTNFRISEKVLEQVLLQAGE